MKIEQRKVWGPEWGPQVKQSALLANPIYTEQAQEEEEKKNKKIKIRAKIEVGGSLVFWLNLPSRLEDVFSFVF